MNCFFVVFLALALAKIDRHKLNPMLTGKMAMFSPYSMLTRANYYKNDKRSGESPITSSNWRDQLRSDLKWENLNIF